MDAELRLGLGIGVGRAVELLRRRAGLVGLRRRKRRWLVHDTAFAGDLVDRNFTDFRLALLLLLLLQFVAQVRSRH